MHSKSQSETRFLWHGLAGSGAVQSHACPQRSGPYYPLLEYDALMASA